MKTLTLFASTLFITNLVTAQQLKTYNGEYLGGTAEYTYYENSEGERTYHGKFTSTKDGEKTTGNYENGKRIGFWKSVKQTTFLGETEREVKNYTYVMNEVKGRCAYEKSKTNKDGSKAIAEIQCSMLNGRYVGPFSFSVTSVTASGKSDNGDNLYIRCSFDSSGFLHGKMVIKYVKDNSFVTRTALFDRGYKYADKIYQNSTGEILSDYTDTAYLNITDTSLISREAIRPSISTIEDVFNRKNDPYYAETDFADLIMVFEVAFKPFGYPDLVRVEY